MPAPNAVPHPTRHRRRATGALLAIGLALATSNAPAATLAEQLVDALNQLRAERGLGSLWPDESLQALATEHSLTMAASHQLSHAGFEARFQRSGRQLCVENLAAGHHQAEPLLRAWQRSPTHHANLVEPRVQRVGVGVVNGYVTLLACSHADAPAAPGGTTSP